MGTLVKRRWCAAVGLQPDRVYHCAVMPCYDKKLEASREDFWLPGALQLGVWVVLWQIADGRAVSLSPRASLAVTGCAGGRFASDPARFLYHSTVAPMHAMPAPNLLRRRCPCRHPSAGNRQRAGHH